MADGVPVSRLAGILCESGRLARLAVEADRDGQTAEASALYSQTCALLKQCLTAAAAAAAVEDEHDDSEPELERGGQSYQAKQAHGVIGGMGVTVATNWESQARSLLETYETRISALARALPPALRLRVLAQQSTASTMCRSDSGATNPTATMSALHSPPQPPPLSPIGDPDNRWSPLGAFHPLPPVDRLRNSPALTRATAATQTIDGKYGNTEAVSDGGLGGFYHTVASLSAAVARGGFLTRAVFIPHDLFEQQVRNNNA
jgi:hypothetical protein